MNGIATRSLLGPQRPWDLDKQKGYRNEQITGNDVKHGHGSSKDNDMKVYNNTYQSCRGSRVVLEFAEPTLSLVRGPSTAPDTSLAHFLDRHETSPPSPNVRLETHSGMQLGSTQSRRRALQLSPSSPPETSGGNARNSGSRTRLQASFNALKRISSGLRSPWSENGPNRDEDAGPRGYFG